MRYELEDLKAQIRILLHANPELADDEDLRADMLEGCTGFNEVIEKLLDQEKEIEMLVDGVSKRVNDLVGRRNKLKDRQQALRSVILSLMQFADIRKVALSEATVSVIKTGPSVQIMDDSLVPDEMCKFKREASKAAIKEALLAGEYVPGAVLVTGNTTLRIG